MKKRYGNRQNMLEVLMTFAVPQLFLGLMFKRLTFGEDLLFILAVSLRQEFQRAFRQARTSTTWVHFPYAAKQGIFVFEQGSKSVPAGNRTEKVKLVQRRGHIAK
jgi:hypothetical protein